VVFTSTTVSVWVCLPLFLTTFLGEGVETWWRIMILIYTSLHVEMFYPYKIGRVSYGARLISINPCRAPYGARPGIGRCYHIQTSTGARTICEDARKNRPVQAEIVRRQLICDHSISLPTRLLTVVFEVNNSCNGMWVSNANENVVLCSLSTVNIGTKYVLNESSIQSNLSIVVT